MLRLLGRAVGAAHVDGTVLGERDVEGLGDDFGRDVVEIDQQHDAARAGHHSSLQLRFSPPRKGFNCASPKGTALGSVQSCLLSVIVPVLRGRP